MKIPLIYNIRSVSQRPVSTMLTALGIGLVVAVFVAMLALANGFIAALVKTGSADNVLLLRTRRGQRAVERHPARGDQHHRVVAAHRDRRRTVGRS